MEDMRVNFANIRKYDIIVSNVEAQPYVSIESAVLNASNATVQKCANTSDNAAGVSNVAQGSVNIKSDALNVSNVMVQQSVSTSDNVPDVSNVVAQRSVNIKNDALNVPNVGVRQSVNIKSDALNVPNVVARRSVNIKSDAQDVPSATDANTANARILQNIGRPQNTFITLSTHSGVQFIRFDLKWLHFLLDYLTNIYTRANAKES